MAANSPINGLSEEDSSVLSDTGNGVLLFSTFSPVSANGSSSALPNAMFPGYIAETDESDMYDASEDDEDMSSTDGGVQIGLSSAHAQHLNAEMNMLDAEVMGPYNLAAIATSSAFHSDLDQMDDALSLIVPYGMGEDMTDGLTSHTPSWIGDYSGDGFLQQGEQMLDPMSEVSQQLQHIQDGQEQGGLDISSMQHGSNLGQSTDSLSSLQNPSVSEDGQEAYPYFYELASNVAQLGGVPVATHGSLGVNNLDHDILADYLGTEWDPDGEAEEDEDETQANSLHVQDQMNLTLRDFLYTWGVCATRTPNSKKRKRGPNLVYLDKMNDDKPNEVLRSDLRGDHCDFQGIDWTKLDVSRRDARNMRIRTYRNYTNTKLPARHTSTLGNGRINDNEDYLRFRRMDLKPKVFLSHFQLRNLLACTSRSSIIYAADSKVIHVNPLVDQRVVRMDLRSPTIQPPHALQPFQPIQISTVAADHNLVIAGGFYGEYGMTRLDAPPGSRHIEGLMTHDPNPITNHIQIYLNRHSGLPQAAFASNDNGLRILDCMTNTIAAQHKFDYAVNCSAISPDHRLRVLVGDTRNVIVANAETGDTLQELGGHEDYGFACAWADNGWHVATGNQDKLIKVWDARMWTDHHGVGKPLKTIAATMAGARSLKFSPLGSGKRVLVASEAADIVSVIDAETYNKKQTLDLYGEICGVDFTPDGSLLFVGINDPLRGGIMEFERCGFGGLYGFKEKEVSNESGEHRYVHTMQQDVDEKFTGLDWRKTDSEVVSHPRSKLTATHLRRRAARSRDMDPF